MSGSYKKVKASKPKKKLKRKNTGNCAKKASKKVIPASGREMLQPGARGGLPCGGCDFPGHRG